MPTYKPGRLFVSESQSSFRPSIENTPDLPAIDWSKINQTAPMLVTDTSKTLPKADAIVITWAEAEWAAMVHVFCNSAETMPYSSRNTSTWSGWTKYETSLPANPPSGWSYWGEWRLVKIGSANVLLFKSNTHLDWPGQTYLLDMINLLIENVKPSLILSIGTAGGAQVQDHVGTIRAVSAGTLFEADATAASWPAYTSSWTAVDTVIDEAAFAGLLFPIPTTSTDLQSLCTQFNQHYGTSYTLSDLDPNSLSVGDTVPRITDQTGGATSLLTTPTFVVGTTAGTYEAFASIEMDDALIGKQCAAANVDFGFVRNISDPVQNVALSAEAQGNWGSTIYDTYGLYTSYNGALAACVMLAARYKA